MAVTSDAIKTDLKILVSGDTEVTFTMNGFNRTVAINGINDLRIFIQDGRAIYNGVPLAFSTTGCPITIDGDCQDGTDLSADVTVSCLTTLLSISEASY